MGHADLTNISTIFIDLLVERKTVSIAEVVRELKRKKETVNASEGRLDEPYMLSYACENVVGFLLVLRGTTARTPQRKKTPVIRPVEPLTKKQEKLLREFCDNDNGDWDCGPNGNGGEYGAFDRIKWELHPTWAKIPKNNLPLLQNFEN
jgi:hypothetical protein